MKPPEEVAREIIDDWVSGEESTEDQHPKNPDGPYFAHLERRITAALTAERQRLKDAEKWMRHTGECEPYVRIMKVCICGLDDFRKERER